MGEPVFERRLTAVLSADAVGYSRLMERDEEGTHTALKAHRADVIDPAVASHGGRVVKWTGDGVLAEFQSIVGAVQCAVAVQQEMHFRNADVPEPQRMRFRLGVNHGDVIVDEGDIFGDGVNLAVRLQEVAEPGGACIPDDVYRQVQGQIDVEFADAGAQRMKNIDRPIRLWRWRGDATLGDVAGPDAAGTLLLPGRPSIAVLAFENLSREDDQDYFADGITEDIITALCKFRWFFVISRDSTFTYKGRNVSVKDIARELGVRYVLEGSVRKAGSRVRVSCQLVDAASGANVWAERFDRELADIFALQDEMTETIVTAIEPELSGAERARAKSQPPDSLDVWDLFQRGQWHYGRWNRADAVEADRLFRSAIALDDGFAPAYSILALSNLVHVLFGWTAQPQAAVAEAFELAQRAVALDDRDPMAHFALGRAYTIAGELETAIAELNRSLELNPNHARGYFGLGLALHWFGRADEAQPYFRRAIRQSPHDPMRWAFESSIGSTYFHAGAHEDAVAWLKKAVSHPNSGFHARLSLAANLAELGQFDEARAELAIVAESQPDLTLGGIATMLRTMNDTYRERYLKVLRKAGLPE